MEIFVAYAKDMLEICDMSQGALPLFFLSAKDFPSPYLVLISDDPQPPSGCAGLRPAFL